MLFELTSDPTGSRRDTTIDRMAVDCKCRPTIVRDVEGGSMS